MMKCDYIGCTSDATTSGHIYGHLSYSGKPDELHPVNACDKHKQEDGFFEQVGNKDE
jgi:hypothetical protein